MPYALKTTNLTKYYGAVRGIDGVELAVDCGDMVGFIGPNGAGKSTTIRVLLGLLKPTDGSAEVLGDRSWQLAPDSLRRIGYLPSAVSYYDRMRVGAFLRATARFYRAECEERTRDLCRRLDVDVTRRFGDLSLGNRKKVGIVQCFMHRPELVILDEPTSGLDPLVQSRFFELLKEENERGVTVFLSSHTLSEVQNHCRRVAIIRGGTIVEAGDVSDLRRRTYRKVRIVASAKTIERLASLESVAVESRDGRRAVLIYQGPPARFLEHLDAGSVEDLLIEEPSLEEIFLHYYREDDD